MSKPGGIIARLLWWLVVFLAISAAYLFTFPQANIPYAGVVLLHALAGALATLFLVPFLIRLLHTGNLSSRTGWLLIAVGAVVGAILIKTGTPRSEWNKFYAYIVISLAGIALLVAGWLTNRAAESQIGCPRMSVVLFRTVICLVVFTALGFASHYIRDSWQSYNRIQNPTMPPD